MSLVSEFLSFIHVVSLITIYKLLHINSLSYLHFCDGLSFCSASAVVQYSSCAQGLLAVPFRLRVFERPLPRFFTKHSHCKCSQFFANTWYAVIDRPWPYKKSRAAPRRTISSPFTSALYETGMSRSTTAAWPGFSPTTTTTTTTTRLILADRSIDRAVWSEFLAPFLPHCRTAAKCS